MSLRLDDTNPSKEKEEFQDAIIEDLTLIGIKPDGAVTYTSDYFQYLYEMCIKLIKQGDAYADDTELETMRDERMKGIASKRRDRSVEETLRIFEEMKVTTNFSPRGKRACKTLTRFLRSVRPRDSPTAYEPESLRTMLTKPCATRLSTDATFKMLTTGQARRGRPIQCMTSHARSSTAILV